MFVHWVEMASIGAGPQLSTALHESVNDPHPYPNVPHVFSGTHVHECAFGSQAPPSHPPQAIGLPQPLSPVPHCQPRSVHVFGVHPHCVAFPLPPQVSGAWHVSGHCTTTPHPSSMLPHWAFSDVHVIGTHVPEPHWSVPPPPHVVPASQVPHESVFPQPSGTLPHSALKSEQASGWHLHWCVTSHVSFAFVQSPQSTARPHPSWPTPHSQPSCGQDGTAPQDSPGASPPVASVPPPGPSPAPASTPEEASTPASGAEAEKD